jgi:hypothetical protein
MRRVQAARPDQRKEGGLTMQWFKHSKDFRNRPEIQYIEDQLGDAGYARACKFLEIVATVAGKKKPFEPTLVIEPPYSYRWLAMELNCFFKDDHADADDRNAPCEPEVVNTFRVFEKAGFIDVIQEADYTGKRWVEGEKKDVTEQRPYVITVGGMKHWAEWHDVKNRNRRGGPVPEGGGKARFAGIQTPGCDDA